MHGRTLAQIIQAQSANFPILFENSLWPVFRILYFSFHSFSLIGPESRSLSSLKRQKSKEIEFIQMKYSSFRVHFICFLFSVCLGAHAFCSLSSSNDIDKLKQKSEFSQNDENEGQNIV